MNETIHALCAHSQDLFGELLFRAQVATSGRYRPGARGRKCELGDDEIKAEVRRRFSRPDAKVVLYRAVDRDAPVLPAMPSREDLAQVISEDMADIQRRIDTALKPWDCVDQDMRCLWFETAQSASVRTGLVVFAVPERAAPVPALANSKPRWRFW